MLGLHLQLPLALAALLVQLVHLTEQMVQILYFLLLLQQAAAAVQAQIQVVRQPILEVVVEAVDMYQVRRVQALAVKVLPEAQLTAVVVHLAAEGAAHRQLVELGQQPQQRV